jgi:tRNA A-37 threonylcarbamoyl transferase component Bud32/TolB-like protein
VADLLDRLKTALSDRYTIERELGAGGMATVYLAQDLKHERQVAVKVLRPELAAALGSDRFLQEVKIAANLTHPHILPLHDSGDADGFLYYVMPYIEGESLREKLAKEGELPVTDAVRILKEVVDALAEAHSRGVVHRDIKPDNVMLRGRHALVTDFGVAKAVSEATGRHKLTTEGVALGTPAYMAPEQAAADPHIDHRADIYAVGAVAYELLTGRPPFTGNTQQEILAAHVTQAPEPVTKYRESVPPALEQLVLKCLEKKAADRWQTAEELIPQLEALATPSGGMTPTGAMPVDRVAKRRWVMAGTASVVIVLGLWIGLRSPADLDVSGTATTAEPDRVVVPPFENLTGDASLDVLGERVAEWTTRAVDRAAFIPVVSMASVRDARAILGPGAASATLAAEVGARYVIRGSYLPSGGGLEFSAEILDVTEDALVDAIEPLEVPTDSLDVGIARVAGRTAAALALKLDPDVSVFLTDMPPPPSLEAFNKMAASTEAYCRQDYVEAIRLADEALVEAPGYFSALNHLQFSYGNLGRYAAADSVHRIIEAMRDRLSPRELADHDWFGAMHRGNYEQAQRAVEEGFRMDPVGFAFGAGLTAYRRNQLGLALERFATLNREAPCYRDWRDAWFFPAAAHHLLGEWEEELDVARSGRERFPDDARFLQVERRALIGMGSLEDADSVLAVYPSSLSPLGLIQEGLEWRAHGYPERARLTMERGLARFAERPAAELRYSRGTAYYYAGLLADADTLLGHLVEESPEVVGYLGFWGVTLAALGRDGEASEVSLRLEALADPFLRGVNTRWRAAIAAQTGDAVTAARLLQQAIEEGAVYTLNYHRDPWWDPVREDTRVRVLIEPRR